MALDGAGGGGTGAGGPLRELLKFFRHLLHRASPTFHLLVGAGMAHELWITALAPVVGGIFARNKLDDTLVRVLMFLLTLNSLATLWMYFRLRREHREVENLRIAREARDLEIGSATRYGELTRGIARRFATASAIATTLAELHSNCDRELFDALNEVLSYPKGKTALFRWLGIVSPFQGGMLRAHKRAISKASYLIEKDISDTLERICLYMNAYTEDICSACIKFYKINPTSIDLKDALVVTEYRDVGSRNNRMLNEREYQVFENTITRKIFLERLNAWGRDDLKAMGNDYVNLRPEWWEYYNATLGVGILDYSPGRLPSPYSAVLCVDNKKGALNNPVCKDFLMREGLRLAAMLHRFRRLALA
jgi:hypothetical protein